MSENRGMNIMRWAVALLVLCNMGLVATIWLKPQQHDGPHGGGGPRDFIVHKLHFTADQVAKYDVMIQAHRQAMNRLNHDGMEYRQALFANLKNEKSGINADSLIQLIGNSQKQIEAVTYAHFAEVRALCTEEQKQEFDKIIADVTRMMAGHGNHEPPPHRDDAHDGPNGDAGPPPPDAPQNH